MARPKPINPQLKTKPSGGTYVVWYDADGKRHRNMVPSGTDPEEYAASFTSGCLKEHNPTNTLLRALSVRSEQPCFGVSAVRIYSNALKAYERAGCDIELMRNQLAATRSPGTVHIYLRAIKTLNNWAVKYGLIQANPCADLYIPAPDHRVKDAPTREERDRIMKHLASHDPELHTFVAVVHYAFIRIREAVRLQPADYNFKNRTIYVRAAIAKNRHAYYVDILPPLLKILKSAPPVFNSSPEAYERSFRRHMQKLGLPYTLYSMKHCGATLLQNAGAPLSYIRDQCRHANIATTDRYLRQLGGGNRRYSEFDF